MTIEKKRSLLKDMTAAFLPSITIFFAISYLIIRTILFFQSPNPWYEKIVAMFLLLAELFILVHGIGYFMEIRSVYRKHRKLTSQDELPPLCTNVPPVTIIVSSYREPLNVVQETITCLYNLQYPNKQVVFLDDTRYDLTDADPVEMKSYRKAIEDLCKKCGVDLFRRRWHGAKAGMINDFLQFLAGNVKEGFEFTCFSGNNKWKPPKYLVVFDADCAPVPNFLAPVVATMESDERLAFVQTPQYYTNFENNRIARASGLQQAVFYEYICEGKSIHEAMFCCGTNVIFRREALMDVGGFEEESVTEDFATSLKFHLKGWRSRYMNKIMTFQMGPEDLEGYFKQQFRWALGTVGLLRQIIKHLIHNPTDLFKVRYWEYIISTTYYFIGMVFLILVLCPIIYIFFNVPSYFANPWLYVLFFVPYFIMSMTVFLWALKERNYRPIELFTGQLLIAITFPVYTKAALQAIAGIKGNFGVTNKTGASSLPLRVIWAQTSLALICFVACVWGVNRLIFEQDAPMAVLINIFWCAYHALVLCAVFYFNNPEERSAAGSLEAK